ncbi:exosortase/archaeosortase family protein, partial [archaeon]|nr:exosortase/archaeosortase family protein [archaeon]
LILVTRGIKLLTRIKIWIYGCLLILVFNTLRIFLLIWIYVTFGQNYFDALHLVFWHVISTVVVVLIWIGLTKKYKVKGIPIYSDFKYILSLR